MKKAIWTTLKGGLKPAGSPREKKQRRIRPVSKAQAKRLAEYRKVRAEYLKDNPFCESCGWPATDVHHKKGRVGSLLLDKRYFIGLCRGCHRRVDSERKMAYALDLLLHDWNNPK
jgi:hypothetical protein